MVTGTELQGEYRPPVPSRVIFGRGKLGDLSREIQDLGGRRALILSGRSVAEQTDAVRRTRECLGDACVGVYSGLTQRAPLSTAVAAARLALDTEADTLVGVGGSTISDASRMIAVMMADGILSEERLRELGHEFDGMLEPDLAGKSLPFQVSLPTTLSAGEFNQGGGNILDDRANHKIRVRNPRLYADLIVLDPDLTMGTPDWLWLSTGVKAMDHCIERLYCRGSQPAVDATSLMAAELLFNNLSKSAEGYHDHQARLQCLMAAWMSMMGCTTVGSGLSHGLGHVIGVKYNVGHGYTSCVTQPWVMEYNRPASSHKQALLARAAGIDIRGMSDEAAAQAAAQVVDEFIMELGMPHRLRDLEIPKEDFEEIAALTLRDGAGRNNPIPITSEEQVLEVLDRAW